VVVVAAGSKASWPDIRDVVRLMVSGLGIGSGAIIRDETSVSSVVDDNDNASSGESCEAFIVVVLVFPKFGLAFRSGADLDLSPMACRILEIKRPS
jgi:hypothetical protein